MTNKKNLVIVESPAKAKTLKKFLGSNYKIEASMGHVRDLPKSEIGIDIEKDFEPRYITIRGKGPLLTKLRKEIKNASKIYLATDPDREGEAISWHLFYALNLENKPVYRITFNEITKTAVQKSIKEAREIDMDLVDAQQARRSLDRIVGYKISPFLWKKIKKGLSAGRVQSVALKLICERDEEIENFVPKEYWTIDADLKTNNNKILNAKFYGTSKGKIELESEKQVDEIIKHVKKNDFIIKEIKESKRLKNPYAPFKTSTMQQEASKLFGYPASKTMMIAQQLYEGVNVKGEGTIGLVSYIRTDSVRISDEAFTQAKQFITEFLGEKYLSKSRKEYKTKGKTQDAHEAIRPTYVFKTPEHLKDSLTNEQYKLYKLIWERFIASQMESSVYKNKTIKINGGDYEFRTTGSTLEFDGYLKIYKKNEEKEEELLLPEVNENDKLDLKQIKKEQHFTKPPARYTEASLIKTLEDIGVGRPSTYAPTISTLTSRRYITKEKKLFYTTELGEIVNDVIKNNFPDIINIDFTAEMENKLDKIEEGKLEWKQILRDFYPDFQKAILDAEEKVENIAIEDEKTDIICENCGANMVIKYGRYGKFLACPKFPNCKNTKPLFEETGLKCPECGGAVLIKKTKTGRKFFGCENNPECNFMSWNKPTGERCPKCNSYMVEKGTKKTIVSCSNQECGYILKK